MQWISVKKRKPYCRKKFNESDYVLVYNASTSELAVAWYNKLLKKWTISHHEASSVGIDVTHWMPLPEPPKE